MKTTQASAALSLLLFASPLPFEPIPHGERKQREEGQAQRLPVDQKADRTDEQEQGQDLAKCVPHGEKLLKGERFSLSPALLSATFVPKPALAHGESWSVYSCQI
jgi:hypothetical protein